MSNAAVAYLHSTSADLCSAATPQHKASPHLQQARSLGQSSQGHEMHLTRGPHDSTHPQSKLHST